LCKLQNDLIQFDNWCQSNSLCINVSKYSQITFTKRKKPITFNYFIGTDMLNIKTYITDLGIILSSGLTFNEHITLMCNKTTRMFGFLKQNLSEFNDPNCLKT